MIKKDSYVKMNIADFRKEGFLQEANRQWFHPLGLTLVVAVNDDGTENLLEIRDYREHEEGPLFNIDESNKERMKKLSESVAQARREREILRSETLGYVVQPI